MSATHHRSARTLRRVAPGISTVLLAVTVGLSSAGLTAAGADPDLVLPEGTVAVATYEVYNSCCQSGEVSYNPVSGRTIAVWIAKGGANDSDHVMAALVEPGDPVATVGPAVQVSVEKPPTGWFTGMPATVTPTPEGGWLVTYENRDEASVQGSPVYGQFLDEDGQRIGTNLQLTSDVYFYTGMNQMVAYVADWSAEHERYLLTWNVDIKAANDIYGDLAAGAQDKVQVVGRFLSAAGAGIGADFPITQLPSGARRHHMDMAAGQGLWVVVGHVHASPDTFVQVVDENGPVGAPVVVSDPDASGAAYAGTITYNAALEEFLVLYRGGDEKLWMRRLDVDGAPIGTGPTEVPGVPAQFGPRVTAAGLDGYLVVVHTDWGTDVVLFQLDATGELVAGSLETVASGADPGTGANFLERNFRPSITFDPRVGPAITWWGVMAPPIGEPTTGLYLRFLGVAQEEEKEEEQQQGQDQDQDLDQGQDQDLDQDLDQEEDADRTGGGQAGDGQNGGEQTGVGGAGPSGPPAAPAGSWVPSSGAAPELAPGSAEWQLEDGSVVPLTAAMIADGRLRYSAEGLTVTFSGGAGSSVTGGLVVDADGNVECEVCAELAPGGMLQTWMFSSPRLVAAHEAGAGECQTFTVALGAPLDGGGPIGAGAHTLQVTLPTVSGLQAVNVGVTVGGPVPGSVPSGEGSVPSGAVLVALLLAAAGSLLVGRRLVTEG